MENKKIVDIDRLNRYHDNLKTKVLTTKQDVISDLETIRTGATAGATALSEAQTFATGLVQNEDGTSKFDTAGSAEAAQSAAISTAASALEAYKTEAGFAYATKAEAENAFTAAQTLLNLELPKKADVADVTANTSAINVLKGEGEGSVKAAAAAAQSAAQSYADGLAVNYDAAGSANTALDNAKAYVNDIINDKEVEGETVKGLNSRIADLEAIDHGQIAVDAAAGAVAAIVAGADSDFDTLKEVADWILSDTTGAAGLQTTVSGHTEDIKEINDELDALDANKQDVISDLETIRSGAAAGATALQADDLAYATNDDIDGLFA